ncbi:SDR family NAD(P)-dependent oxidoreductase [candidate division GN15 bacterium]|nr:SDR family NAD(P)-dependent oxidoreductase [candidate division GN15 bacterium]
MTQNLVSQWPPTPYHCGTITPSAALHNISLIRKTTKEGCLMQSLSDKVVVITGASKGIGAGIAETLASENPRLVLVARKKADLQKVADRLDLPKKQVAIVPADVSKTAGMRKIVNTAYRKFGRVDIFINNAGVGIMKPIVEMTEKEYDLTMNTNLKSIFLSFKEVIPKMQEQGGGQIINVSSMAAKQGVPGLAAYAASKAGLNILADSVGGEVRNDRIKISTLAPASTETGFGSTGGKKRPSSSAAKKLTVTEVAEAVLFMARQNDNAWVSMADIRPLLKKK